MMDSLFDTIGSDKTRLLGFNHSQELWMLCQLAKVFDLKEMRTSPKHGGMCVSGRLRAVGEDVGFLAEELLPAIGFITLVVPRKSITKLTALEATPVLQTSVKQIRGPFQQQFENIFSTIQGMFGELDETRCNQDRCVMYENERSWSGTSDLIICFRAPILSLLLGPRDGIRISLHLSSTDPISPMYYRTLGNALCVFETGLDDPRVKLARQHTIRTEDINQTSEPNIEEPLNLQNLDLSRDPPRVPQLTAFMGPQDGGRLQYHIDLGNDAQASKALTAGNQVSILENSPCTITVSFGNNCSRRIAFPMPVSCVNHKLRIARKSQWVEVTATISLAGETDGYNTNPFPGSVDLSPAQPSLTSWSLPYVPLEKCAQVPLEPAMDFSWVHPIFTLSYSDADYAAFKPGTLSPLQSLKDSIKAIFLAAMGMGDKKKGTFIASFHFAQRDDTGINTLLMVDAVRHDPTTQCIVLDAYVVPLTVSRVQKYYDALAKWTKPSEPVLSIGVEPSETRLWKYLLPACAERCRAYPHKSSCEYKVDGVVPRSLEIGKPAICSCGEGKVSASFMANPMHAPFAKIATRVAIAPLFPVPYVEECFGILKQGLKVLRQKQDREERTSGLEGCLVCGKTTSEGGVELKRCAKCRKVAYCGRACQTQSWPSHKKDCEP